MSPRQNCQGMTRRDCLQLGLGALAGGGFVELLRARAVAGTAKPAVAKSCILIWHGRRAAPLRDVRPQAGRPERNPRRVQADRDQDPGRPLLAAHEASWPPIADKLAIVRSIRHDQGNHGAGNHYMMTGAPPRIPVGCGAFVSFHPSLGSVAAHERGAPGGPAGLLLDARRCRGRAGRTSSAPAMLRSSSPTIPARPSFRVRDVALPQGLDGDRFESAPRPARPGRSAAAHRRQGRGRPGGRPSTSITSRATSLICVEARPGRVRHPPRAGPRPRRLRPRRRSASVRCWPAGWSRPACRSSRSTKAAGTITPSSSTTCAKRLPSFEATIAALIEDLDQRGLLASTLVIALGEFGRTPQDQQGRRPRSLVERHVGAVRRRRHARAARSSARPTPRATPPSSACSRPRTSPPPSTPSSASTPARSSTRRNGRPSHLVSDPTPISELCK